MYYKYAYNMILIIHHVCPSKYIITVVRPMMYQMAYVHNISKDFSLVDRVPRIVAFAPVRLEPHLYARRVQAATSHHHAQLNLIADDFIVHVPSRNGETSLLRPKLFPKRRLAIFINTVIHALFRLFMTDRSASAHRVKMKHMSWAFN